MISVIMSVFNEESHVRLAIESILNQTFGDFELIIIDDASTDGTLGIISELAKKDARIRYLLNKENKGLAYNLNRGIEISKGDIIARMDADDFSLPQRFEKQVDFLKQNLNVEVVGTSMISIDDLGKEISKIKMPKSHREIENCIHQKNPFVHPSVMIRKSFFIKVGLYNEKLKRGQDYELWARAIKLSTYANLQEELIKYRVNKRMSLKSQIYAFKIRLLLFKNMMDFKYLIYAFLMLIYNGIISLKIR